MNQLKISVFGHSGAGKSTFTGFARDWAAARGANAERIGLAEPLYEVQQFTRDLVGAQLAPTNQDQLLLEAVASSMRTMDRESIARIFLGKVQRCTSDLVINDDLRDPDVDAERLRSAGFVFIRVQAGDTCRRARLAERGDATRSDASSAFINEIQPDHVITNDETLDEYREQIFALLDECAARQSRTAEGVA